MLQPEQTQQKLTFIKKIQRINWVKLHIKQVTDVQAQAWNNSNFSGIRINEEKI